MSMLKWVWEGGHMIDQYETGGGGGEIMRILQ
jgi:hypothetical protein